MKKKRMDDEDGDGGDTYITKGDPTSRKLDPIRMMRSPNLKRL